MPPLSIMIKPASSLCNLRCTYCFYHDVAEHRKAYRFEKMSCQTADRLIDSALRFADGESIAFAFQGGEPLLAGMDFFLHFVERVTHQNEKNSPIYYSIQTNGTLVDEAWAAFFRKYDFLVGLSLDGPYTANHCRVDKAGENCFDQILRAADMMKAYQVKFNILTVLTGEIAERAEEVYTFFKEQNFRYLQFIPCLRPFGDRSESQLYMTNDQYAYFLIHLFNAYVKDYVRGNYVSIRQFDNWVKMYLGQPPEQCGMCGHCMHQFVAEGNGNIYPCDFYCLDEWLLGNINKTSLEDMANSKTALLFLKESLPVKTECRQCRFFPLCRGGGCKRSRADRDYCRAYKEFFSACYPLFRVFRFEK